MRAVFVTLLASLALPAVAAGQTGLPIGVGGPDVVVPQPQLSDGPGVTYVGPDSVHVVATATAERGPIAYTWHFESVSGAREAGGTVRDRTGAVDATVTGLAAGQRYAPTVTMDSPSGHGGATILPFTTSPAGSPRLVGAPPAVVALGDHRYRCLPGEWADAASYRVTWNIGGNHGSSPILGAMGWTYRLTGPAFESALPNIFFPHEQHVACRVFAGNAAGESWAQSAASAVLRPEPGDRRARILRNGDELRCETAPLLGGRERTDVLWLRDGEILGAMSSLVYPLGRNDVGHRISCWFAPVYPNASSPDLAIVSLARGSGREPSRKARTPS